MQRNPRGQRPYSQKELLEGARCAHRNEGRPMWRVRASQGVGFVGAGRGQPVHHLGGQGKGLGF